MVDFSIKEEEPPKILSIFPGVRSFLCRVDTVIFLPIGIIAYAELDCNMLTSKEFYAKQGKISTYKNLRMFG